MGRIARHLFLFAVFCLHACADSDKRFNLETSEQRLSYGLAYLTGKDLIKRGMVIDPEAYAAGIRDAASDVAPQISEEEIRSEMAVFQDKMRLKERNEQQIVSEKNKRRGETFLQENKNRDGVSVTSSGLQYEILREGKGESPTSEDSVEVHYEGKLIDGTVFDSSYKKGETINFAVTQVIPGWTEALKLMSVGAKWKIFIRSALAYGPGGVGGLIGPNETLIFEVELLSIAKNAELDQKAEK